MFIPDGIFVMERPFTAVGGAVEPAVHLGHHHGLDAALFMISAMLLSRVILRAGKRATAARWYISLLFAYGLVNLVEGAWNEQLLTHGWVHWTMPSAQNPGLTVMWLIIIALTAVTALTLSNRTQWLPSLLRARRRRYTAWRSAW